MAMVQPPKLVVLKEDFTTRTKVKLDRGTQFKAGSVKAGSCFVSTDDPCASSFWIPCEKLDGLD